MRWRWLGALLLGALLFSANETRADLRNPPFKVSLQELPHAAVAGRTYSDVLRIRLGENAIITDIDLNGDGWTVESLVIPDSRTLTAGGLIEIPFSATPTNPDAALVLRWRQNGKEWTQVVDVSPEACRRALPEVAVAGTDRMMPAQSTAPGEPGYAHPMLLQRVPSMDEIAKRSAPPVEPGASATRRTITVTGSVSCLHEMTTTVPVRWTLVLVYAWDDEGHANILPASGLTNGYGSYSIPVSWTWATNPNIQVLYAASNSWVQMQENDIYEDTWTVLSPVYENIAADALGVPFSHGTTSNVNAAFYIAETIGRGGERLEDHYGLSIPIVECLWPEGDGSYYSSVFEEVHISQERRWIEGTHLHEYGHFVHDVVGIAYQHDWEIFYYCNGVCDDVVDWWFDDCGHCMWCEETTQVAWNEGLANLISRILTDYIDAAFSTPAHLDIKPIETFDNDTRCDLPTPGFTEGHVAGAIYDLIDEQDAPEDTGRYPGYYDRIGGWDQQVFDVLADPCPVYGRWPHTAPEFALCFINRFPSVKEDVWEAFKAHGMDVDTDPPGAPRNLDSSHVPGVPSPDATVYVAWDPPLDDASGASGYSYTWSGVAGMPDAVEEAGAITNLVSPPLPAASWYFSIRAKDRAGHWSDTYASRGPFVIQTADPADLQYDTPAGWDFPVVPRNDTATGYGDVHVSLLLDGGQSTTWWNAAGENTGDQASPSTRVAVYVDGDTIGSTSWSGLPAYGASFKRNVGPITVPGGRHILGMWLDSSELVPESAESDNYWAGQWVWQPPTLSSSSITIDPPPPVVTAGLDYFAWATPFAFNCRGYRLAHSSVFQAVMMHASAYDRDYDLKLFARTTSASSGFSAPLAASERPLNRLEAVIIDNIGTGFADHHVGTYYLGAGSLPPSGLVHIRGVASTDIGVVYGTYTSCVNQDRMLDLYAFSPPSGSGGEVTLTLAPHDSSNYVYMAYFPPGFQRAGLLDGTTPVMAGPGSPASLTLSSPVGQLAALAVWREPIDGRLWADACYDLTYMQTPADMAAVAPANWAGPIVPRNSASIGPPYDSVPAPPLLYGSGNTYLYYSDTNLSPAPAGQHDITARIDGNFLKTYLSPSPLGGNATYKSIGTSPVVMNGGRHALSIALDENGAIGEVSELNNRFARQWIWRPVTVDWNTPQTATLDVDPLADMEDLPPDDAFYFNCLGFRTPVLDSHVGRFSIVYAHASSLVDPDLRIHDASTGAEDGFGVLRGCSALSPGSAEFIVISEALAGPHTFDVGIVRSGESNGTVYYQGDATGTTVISTGGSYGPYTMTGGDFVDIHELHLSPGRWRIRLLPSSGYPSLSLHDNAVPFSGRIDALAESAGGAAGETQEIVVDLAETKYLPLAVWRRSIRDYSLALSYTLEIGTVSGAPEGDGLLPTVTRIMAAAPSPFREETTIVFALGNSSDARITVHTLQGAVVRELLTAVLPAGEHRAYWNGRDDEGRLVASGVYLVTLRAGRTMSTTKVLRLR